MARSKQCSLPASGSLARTALLAFAALVLGCGSELPLEVDVVRIVAPDFGRGAGPQQSVSGSLWENGAEREILLGVPRKRIAGGPWRERVLREAKGGPPFGRLLLGPNGAALLYHLASRDPSFPRGALQANRLVAFEAGGVARLGLLVERGAGGRGAFAAAAGDLPLEDAARAVALAQALGAWDVVAGDRHPVDVEDRPFLPFFVPRAGGDWRVLTEASLDAFLPPALATRFVRRQGFRRLQYRHLAEFSARLPELAAAVKRFAASAEAPDLADDYAQLQALLAESFEAYRGYLDSAWIELVVAARPPDAAHIRIYVHSVTDVALETLSVKMPSKLLVVENEALSALRLAPATGADAIGARLGKDRLEFSLDTAVAPSPRGPNAFAGTRLDFELTGLAPLAANFWPLLDQLRLRASNRANGAAIPGGHVQKIVSLEDARFAVGPEAGGDAFLASLGSVLDRVGAAAPGPLLDVDRGSGAFVLGEGTYVLNGDLVLPAGRGLIVEAGVELRVQPGKSLLVRGPLAIRGTRQRPVRVRGVSLAEAWGVLAVQGRGRSAIPDVRPRCEIRYLELSGGSEDYLKGVFYSGQLSVYHADLLLEHAHLSRAFADDALNAKYSAVEIRDSVFVDNRADGVDLDWSDGVVQRSFFGRSGSGGDGLDVSGAHIRVEDSVFSDVRDKCLSVGERSTLALHGSLLRACDAGVVSKDQSLAEVRETVLIDNGRNFSAYQKKPFFGGGRIRGEDLLLVGAAEADSSDALSEIALARVRTLADPASGGIDVDALRKTSAFSRERFRALAAPQP